MRLRLRAPRCLHLPTAPRRIYSVGTSHKKSPTRSLRLGIFPQVLPECGDETNFGVVCRSWKNDLLNVMSLRFGFQILKLPSSCPPTLAVASHEPHSFCDSSQLLGHIQIPRSVCLVGDRVTKRIFFRCHCFLFLLGDSYTQHYGRGVTQINLKRFSESSSHFM